MSWKEEGREEGRQEGQAQLLLRLLQRRCGSLPSQAQDRIRTLSVEQLEKLGEALLDFRSVSDLDQWLNTQSAIAQPR
jgi:predicted transposase YdaD